MYVVEGVQFREGVAQGVRVRDRLALRGVHPMVPILADGIRGNLPRWVTYCGSGVLP